MTQDTPIHRCRCGGRAIVYPVKVHLLSNEWAVVCTACSTYGPGPVRWRKQDAIDAWNAIRQAEEEGATDA